MPRVTKAIITTVIACCFVGPGLFCCGSRAGEVLDTKDYFIQTFGIQDGLPHEVCHRVIQDRAGYLWVSTSGGLVRYDGNQIKLFSSPVIRNEESDVVYATTCAQDGNLWIVPNSGGLVEWDGNEFIQRGDKTQMPGIPAGFVTQAPDGAFWVGYFEARLLRWKDGKATWFTRENGLIGGQTISLAADREGRIWIASDAFLGDYEDGQLVRRFPKAGNKLRLAKARSGGVWVAGSEQLQKLDGGKLSPVATNTPWANVLGSPSVVFEDDSGTLWIGTKGLGLFRFTQGSFERMPTSHPWITDITGDREGNIWVTTRGGGINRLRAKHFLLLDAKAGMPESVSTSICEDSNHNIWITYDGKAVVQLPEGQFDQKREFLNDPWKNSLLACPDRDSQLWIASHNSLMRPLPDGTLVAKDYWSRTNVSLRCLFCRNNGEVWAGGDRGFLGFLRGAQWTQLNALDGPLTSSMVRCMEEDKDGAMWLGLNAGDVLQYRGGQFTHLDEKEGLPGSMVRCMLRDSSDHLWMVTTRDGLLLRDGNVFRRITSAQGFPNEVVDQMVEDNLRRIWFASQVGLYYVPEEELLQCALGKIARLNPIAYGRDSGLMGCSVMAGYQPGAWKSHDGRLWFATYKGVLCIDPASVELETNAPPVLVDEVLLDDQKVSVRAPLVLPAKTRKLDVRLSVIHFSAPSLVKVRHWLEGFDSTWVESGGQRSFTYPKPPPGTYKLRVSASNPDGVWNESVAPLVFTVLPAWWQIRWLQVTGIVVVLGLVVLAVRTWSHRRLQLRLERLEQKQAMEKERARIAKDLHDDLGASLTELGLLADLARNNGGAVEKLKDVAGFFSDRVRGLARTLDTIVWTVNPSNDSLHELATYICEFSQELFAKTSIRCRLDVGEEIPHRPLTPEERSNLFLTAKEAINNVIKHSGATEVWIAIKVENNKFSIVIKDNGRGFNPLAPENAKRNGLANMRSRIHELNGTLAVDSTPGQGTTVALSIGLPAETPLEKK